jgi:hypothetical protein
MIHDFELMLRKLLRDNVAALTDDLQVRFEAPDQDWVDYLGDLSQAGAPVLGVDCCLVEVKESAELRSNEWVESEHDGLVFADPPPMRIECTYLITAWDSATINESFEPGMDEHNLLYNVLACLASAQPINASRIYPAGSAELLAIPDAIRSVDLPTRVVPAEGYARLGEFWQSMGTQIRWRPTVELVVTLPVLIPHEITGPLVHTEFAHYGLNGGPIHETRMTIGVEVLHKDDPKPGELAPVPSALVRLERSGLRIREGIADSAGRLVLSDVAAGTYTLHAWAEGLGHVQTPPIAVPSGSGDYRVTFP